MSRARPVTRPPVSPLMATYPPPPVTLVEGHGARVVDSEGQSYLDFVGGLAVVSLGHSHPELAAAVAAQANRLWHVSNLYGNELAPEVARTIDRLIGGGSEPAGGQVFFANSGAEANECALKLARRHGGPGRHVVISTWNSFHGRTLATVTATGQPAKHLPFAPLPEGFVHVPYDDVPALATALEEASSSDAGRGAGPGAGPGGPAAGVLVEPIQGEGGVIAPSSDYLRAVRQLCDEHGTLLIVDEVQTGLGRTGDWFAFQALGLEPDVVTMAKALGNGMPVGACWARAEVAAAFSPGDHASTFGGQPLALSAVRATLEVMEREDVCGRSRRRGEQLRRRVEELPGVAEVRGRGLLLAAVLEDDRAAEVAAAALRRGLLVNPVAPDAVRFAPPLLVSEEEVDEAVGILADVLRDGR